MWHASVATLTPILVPEETMREFAQDALAGVGSAIDGEWYEFNDGVFYHLRRRLTADEQAIVGEPCDIRGTDEQQKRWRRMYRFLPTWMKQEID